MKTIKKIEFYLELFVSLFLIFASYLMIYSSNFEQLKVLIPLLSVIGGWKLCELGERA